jgi:arginine exporter protein ArgO
MHAGDVRDGSGLDPRRIGIGAACLVGVYGVAIFIDESTAFRLTLGVIGAAMALTLAALVPLPAWRERENRKSVAARAMVAEAVLIAAIITAVRLAWGHG